MTFKSRLLRDGFAEDYILPFGMVPGLIRDLGELGLKPIVVQGSFDFLHPGHNGLCDAAQALDPIDGVVLAGVDNDATVRQNKGPGRPINPLADRLRMIAAMRPVAFAFGYTDTPCYNDAEAYLARWRALSGATVVVSSHDPDREIKEWQAAQTGTEIAFVDYQHENSTTRMLRSVGYEE